MNILQNIINGDNCYTLDCTSCCYRLHNNDIITVSPGITIICKVTATGYAIDKKEKNKKLLGAKYLLLKENLDEILQ
jgi:hypothetical protein